MAIFDPDSISPEDINDLRRAAELAWGEDTRHPSFQEHPDPSQGSCYVTARWLAKRLGGFVGVKKGHYFWVSPDKQYIIDLTGDLFSRPPVDPSIENQLDDNGERIVLEPHHKRWVTGPAVYTSAKNPHYRDFRIIEAMPHERSDIFSKRADAYMRGGIPKQADLMGPTPYPGSTPQAKEDWINEGPMLHDEPTGVSDEAQEYKFVIANGQLQVSQMHNHNQMLDFAGLTPEAQGPIAVGYGQVLDNRVTWKVTSNISMNSVHKMLEEFSDNMGWDFDGMLDSKGNPISDNFGAKKSMWFATRPDGHLIISKSPLPHGEKIRIVGNTAHVATSNEAIEEWAQDFGYNVKETQWTPPQQHIEYGKLEKLIEEGIKNISKITSQSSQMNGPMNLAINQAGWNFSNGSVDGKPLGHSMILNMVPNIDKQQALDPWIKTTSYPGGGNMLDKMKNMPHLDQHNLGDQDAEPEAELGDINNAPELKCEKCDAIFHRINELILHDKDVHNPDANPTPTEDFPSTPFDRDNQLDFGTQPIPQSEWAGLGSV